MVGADVLHHAHVQAEHTRLPRGREPSVMDLLARVVGAQHELRARLDPLHRPSEPVGENGDDRVFRVNGNLRAKTAAGVGNDDADALDGQAEEGGHRRSQGERNLVGRPDRHGQGGRVERGADASGLQGHGGHAHVSAIILDDHVGLGEGALDVADDRADLADDVAGPFVNRGGAGAHGGLGIDHGRARLVLDAHRLAGIGRLVRVGGENRGDRLTHVANLAVGKGALGAGRVEPHVGIRGLRTRRWQRIGQLGEVGGEKDRHAGKCPRRSRIDPHDSRTCVRRTNEREMVEPRWGDVVDEASAPGDQALVFLTSW
jgi:hypothetical protein